MKKDKIIELALFGTSFKMNNGKDAGVSYQVYGMFTDVLEPKSVNSDSYSEILLGTEMKNGTFKPNKYFRQELRAAYNNSPLVAVIEYNTDIGDLVYKSFPDDKRSLRTNPETDTRKVVLDLTAPVECLHFGIMNGKVYFTVDSNGICNKCGELVSLQKEYSDALAVDSIMKSFSNYNMQNSNQFYYPPYQPMSFNPGVFNPLNGSHIPQTYTNPRNELKKAIPEKESVKQKSPEKESVKQKSIKKCSCGKCSSQENKIDDTLEKLKLKPSKSINVNKLFGIANNIENNKGMSIDKLSEIFNSVVEKVYGDRFPSIEDFDANIKTFDEEFKKAIIKLTEDNN